MIAVEVGQKEDSLIKIRNVFQRMLESINETVGKTRYTMCRPILLHITNDAVGCRR